MVNRFLRTASTRRLLATLVGAVVAIGGGAAIALAAGGSGPVPKPARLVVAIHSALDSKPLQGISADINFTNNLIDASEIQGTDPLLTGGSGHVWASGGLLRVELYGDNGDPEIVVNHSSWWVYDPTLNTVYQGTLPSDGSTPSSSEHQTLPTVAQIQADLNHLAAHLRLSGAIPSDVGGQPTYTVTVSPRQTGGLLGQLQLAWDALRGVPLRFAVYARGDSTPVFEVAATNVSYGKISAGDFDIRPPAGVHVVKIATIAGTQGGGGTGTAGDGGTAPGKGAKRHAEISGIKAVAGRLSFKLAAPPALHGLPRQSVNLLDWGSHKAALVTYGQGIGGIAVIEEPASPGSPQKLNLSTGSGDDASGLSLPTVTINGTQGQELDTALGTVVWFTSGNVTYTVIGSVRPAVVDAAARAL